MADLRVLKLALLAETKDFVAGLDKASAESKSFNDKLTDGLKTAATAFAVAAAAAGAFALKIGKDAVQAAIEDEKSVALLANQLKNLTNATEAQLAATEKYITATQNATGVTDTELRTSYERLTRATKDLTQAQRLQQIALDVAAGSGKSLTEISDALALAYIGNTKRLKQLGIELTTENTITKKVTVSKKDLKKATLGAESANLRLQSAQESLNKATAKYGADSLQAQKALNSLEKAKLSAGDASGKLEGKLSSQGKTITQTKKEAVSFEEILTQLEDTFGGSAAAAAETYAGRMEIIKRRTEDAVEALGYALLPTFERISAFVERALVPALEGLIRGLTGGPRSVRGATKESNSAFAEMGLVINENDSAAYGLGEALRNLSISIGGLFTQIDKGTGPESGFVRFINLITTAVEKLDALIAKAREAADAVGRALSVIGLQGPLAAAERAGEDFRSQLGNLPSSGGARVPNININVKGAVDPQSTARTIQKVFTTATSTTGVRITAPSAFGI